MANVPTLLREKTQRVTLTVNGKDWQTWDAKEGGEVASDAGDSFEPGGMAPPIPLGGSAKTGNVTLRRHCGPSAWPRIGELVEAAKKAQECLITQMPLDSDGNPYGTSLVYKGTVIRFTPPPHDSTSATVAMMELEVSVAGYPTLG